MVTNAEANVAFNEAMRSVDEAHHEYTDGNYEACHRLLSNAEWLLHQLQQNVHTHLPVTQVAVIRGGRSRAA